MPDPSSSSASLDARLDDYLKRLKWALSPLPDDDRRDILRETRAHFAERMAEGTPQRAFDEVHRRFGPPETYAQAFLDNYQTTVAVADGSGTAMLPQVLRLAGRGAKALLGAGGFLLLYGAAAVLLLVALLKPVFPVHVGLWYAPAEGVAGMGFVDAETAAVATEWLGYWLIPINLGLALLLYRGTTALLRRFLRAFVRSGDHAGAGPRRTGP
jgi:uncharacterized membrane protein